MIRSFPRSAIIGAWVFGCAGTAWALDCDFLVQYADVTTVSTTVDGELSDDTRSPFLLRATRDGGVELLFAEGDDASVYLQFDRATGGQP